MEEKVKINRYKVMLVMMLNAIQMFFVCLYGIFSTFFLGKTPRAKLTEPEAKWFFSLVEEKADDESFK